MKAFPLIAAALALSAATPGDVSHDELLAFADRFDAAQIAKDGAALEEMVADDLVFIQSSGKREGKAEFIAGWTGPDERYEPIEITDRIVVPLGPDAGIVGGAVVLKGTSAGKPSPRRSASPTPFAASTANGARSTSR